MGQLTFTTAEVQTLLNQVQSMSATINSLKQQISNLGYGEAGGSSSATTAATGYCDVFFFDGFSSVEKPSIAEETYSGTLGVWFNSATGSFLGTAGGRSPMFADVMYVQGYWNKYGEVSGFGLLPREDCIYLNRTDGKVYYWTGSALAELGTAPITTGSITPLEPKV